MSASYVSVNQIPRVETKLFQRIRFALQFEPIVSMMRIIRSRSLSRWRLRALAVAGAGLAFLGFVFRSVFGIVGVEEARYEVLSEHGSIELREYAELVLVETQVDADFEEAGEIAFRRLFAYISGANAANDEIAMTAPVIATDAPAGGEKIAMTAPVLSQREAAGWRYAFVLPASYTLESAPSPVDPSVALSSRPSQKVATLRHSGSWSEAELREQTRILFDWIASEGLEATSSPRFAGYNPPWTIPFLRRNEIMIEVG